MAKQPRLILHIGQRKTGTTWLQSGAERAASAGLIQYEHLRLASWASKIKWTEATEEDFATMAALLPAPSDKPALASAEALVVFDPEAMARAVRAVRPDAHILVTTRAPQEYLLSSFNNDSIIRGGDAADFAMKFGRGHMRRSHALDPILSGYSKVLGLERVHFLPYEMLRDDRNAFLERINALLGVSITDFMPRVKQNASPPAAYTLLSRRVNRLIAEYAPELLETAEWINLSYLSKAAAGSAPDFEAYITTYLAGQVSDASSALPRLRAVDEEAIINQMTVLTRLLDYRPHWRAYGLEGCV